MYRYPFTLCSPRHRNVPYKTAAECCCRASPGNGRLLPILRDTADFAINGDFCKVCGRMFPGRRAVSRLPPARGVMESVRDGCENCCHRRTCCCSLVVVGRVIISSFCSSFLAVWFMSPLPGAERAANNNCWLKGFYQLHNEAEHRQPSLNTPHNKSWEIENISRPSYCTMCSVRWHTTRQSPPWAVFRVTPDEDGEMGNQNKRLQGPACCWCCWC